MNGPRWSWQDRGFWVLSLWDEGSNQTKLKHNRIAERERSYMIPTPWQSKKGSKTMETVKGLVVARGMGKEGWMGEAQGFLGPVKLFCIIL